MNKNKKNICYILMLMLILISISVITIYIPIFLQRGIDAIFEGKYSEIVNISLFILLLSLLQYMLAILEKYTSESFSWSVTNDLRKKILFKLRSNEYMENAKMDFGKIYEYIEVDTKVIHDFLAKTLMSFIGQTIIIIIVLYEIFVTNIYVFVIFLGYVLIALSFLIRIAKYSHNDSLIKEREYAVKVFSKYNEFLTAKKDINALKKVAYIKDKIQKMNDVWLPLKIDAQKFLYKFWSTTVSISMIFSALALLLGGVAYFYKIISIGQIYLLYSYCNMLSEPFKNIQAYLQQIEKYKISKKRIDNILKEGINENGEINLSSFRTLEVNELAFYYTEKDYIFKNLNFQISNGEKVGIYGPSGCGKSTFLKIICKMIEYEEGEININKIPLNQYNLSSIRNKFAYISTNSFIIEDTLFNNITLYTNIPRKKIMELFQNFKLDELSDLFSTSSLDRQISASTVSKGEAQIINILRLFFKDKEIIVFDEATSEIDNITMSFYRKIMVCLLKGKTSILISHNLEQLEGCNRVIPFDTL